MNPGKMVDPYTLDQNLRLGTDYNPRQPVTHFKFPDDHDSFTNATMRCVGVGDCRRHDSGTMCPSYMATREEKHSTRAAPGSSSRCCRATRPGRLEERAVKRGAGSLPGVQRLQGRLPCKRGYGHLQGRVPLHYYAGRLRPVTAYTMGLIYWWARLASHFPRVANFFTQTPVLRDAFKALGGIAPQRNIPAFANQTFKDWFKERQNGPNAGCGMRNAELSGSGSIPNSRIPRIPH